MLRKSLSLLMLLVSIVSAYATERKYDFVVAQDGSGDFTTIQEAINAVPDFRKANRTNILIKKGSYKEKLIIPECKINLTLTGEDGAVITYDDYASKPNRFGEEKSTSGSASCYILSLIHI